MSSLLPPPFDRSKFLKPAGFWIRFVAILIDGAILALSSRLLTFAIFQNFNVEEGNSKISLTYFGLTILFSVFYFGFGYSKKGTTFGKWALGLKVLRKGTLIHMGFGRALAREFIGKAISVFTLMMGYIMAVFRKDKRTLHDMMVDSEVVKYRSAKMTYASVAMVVVFFNLGFSFYFTYQNALKKADAVFAVTPEKLEEKNRAPAQSESK